MDEEEDEDASETDAEVGSVESAFLFCLLDGTDFEAGCSCCRTGSAVAMPVESERADVDELDEEEEEGEEEDETHEFFVAVVRVSIEELEAETFEPADDEDDEEDEEEPLPEAAAVLPCLASCCLTRFSSFFFCILLALASSASLRRCLNTSGVQTIPEIDTRPDDLRACSAASASKTSSTKSCM